MIYLCVLCAFFVYFVVKEDFFNSPAAKRQRGFDPETELNQRVPALQDTPWGHTRKCYIFALGIIS
jgi:hypothetical protein